MSNEHQEWLDGLKVGDEVAIDGSRLSTVTRFTETQIVISSGGRFRKCGGRMLGATWGASWLMEPTQEVRDRIECCRLRGTLGAVKWRDLPLATLCKVNEIVKAASGKAAR